MNVSQRQMQAFLDIARLRSFTRAAERLHITQSGLSAMMRDLESQMNCRLFDRTTRSVSLTAEGSQLVPVASRILAELDSVSDAITQISTRARKILTVGVTPVIAASLMPAACAAFARQYPEISLRVRDISRQKVEDGVASGALDAGFGAFFKAASGIARVPLGEFSLAYVTRAPAGKPGAVGHTRWSELRDKPLVGLPRDNPVQEMIEEQLRRIDRGDEDRPVYENFQTVLAMVEADFGVAVLPSFIAPACRRYQVQFSILVDPVVSLSFYQITKKGRPDAEGIEALAAAVQAGLQVQAGADDEKPR